MKYLPLIVLLGMTAACGKDRTPVRPNLSTIEELANETSRIEPLILFCDGGVAFPRNNNVDGRPNCDVGDSMLFTGTLLSTKPWEMFQQMQDAIAGSILTSGKPHRAPSYAKVDYAGDSFSRDQMLGFLHYLVTTKDQESAKLVINYLKNHNNQLCPGASDGRCDMTLGLKAITDDVYQYIGLGAQYNVNRDLDDNTTLTEARYADVGYPMNLVSQKIFLRVRMNELNSMHSLAAKALADRQPNNMWFQFLNNLTHDGDNGTYETIMIKLTSCMKQWTTPGGKWAFEQDRKTTCEPDAVGADYVWLAKLLMEK